MRSLKNEILENAMMLFLTKSYNEVSIKDIQNSVRCSRGVMYHHFKSKKQIFENVIKEYILPAFSNFSGIPIEKRSTLIDSINSSVEFRVRYIQLFKKNNLKDMSDFHFFKLLFQIGESYEGFIELVNELQVKEANIWAEVVQNAIKNKEIIGTIDINFVVQYFVSLPYGIGLINAFNTSGINCNDIKTHYIQFYNLIRNK